MIFQNLLLLTSTLLVMSPLNISWDKKYDTYPELQDYKYYYGTVSWGEVIYLGTEDILGMESEIQLFFDSKKITKANLILGPAGLNEWNCINKYKKVKDMLIHKYGKLNYIRETKDPLTRDLLFTSACYPISLGMREIDTYWNTKEYQIKMSLVGEDGEFFIEIEYVHKNKDKMRLQKRKDKIIKKF